MKKEDLKLKKSTRNIKYIVVHCTATKEGYDFTAKQIGEWHKQLGWTEIGYNYVVRLNGEVEVGRDVNKIPSHVQGYNTNSIGIVYVGGVDKNIAAKDTRNKEQKSTLLYMLKELKKLYPNAIIQGHRDFPKVKKACPCFDAKTEYNKI